MSKVKYRKVLLSGAKKTLEEISQNLQRLGWEFVKFVTEGPKEKLLHFAVFRRSVVSQIKRRARRLGRSIRERYGSHFVDLLVQPDTDQYLAWYKS